MASLRSLFAANPPRRILAIRTDRVGDLILSTPLLAALREEFPHAHIDALVSPCCREVLAESGLIDGVLDKLALRPNYDLTLALAPRTETLKLAFRSGAPVRLGYTYANRPLVGLLARLTLTHVETVTIKPSSHVPHEVVQLDRLARRLGLPSTLNRRLILGFAQEERQEGRVVLHLGDRWWVGGWTAWDLKQLMLGLERWGPLVVTYGPREKAWMEAHSAELPSSVVYHYDMTLAQWAGLISSASCLVSPDTGAVHVAAAMKTPVVVAYEAATFEHCSQQWAPWKVENRKVCKASPQETIPLLLAEVEELVFRPRRGAS